MVGLRDPRRSGVGLGGLFFIAFFIGFGAGQRGFTTKTPLGSLALSVFSKMPSPSLALGAAGKEVWFPRDLSRWLGWMEEEGVIVPEGEILEWWAADEWWRVQGLSLSRFVLNLRPRWFVARNRAGNFTWERLDTITAAIHPRQRWGLLLQLRHRDPLPLPEARPLPFLEVAIFRSFIGDSFILEVGRNYYRWGPGFWGTPLLSDSGYPLDGIAIHFPLKIPLLGRWKVRQLLTYLHGDMPGRFLVVRRWERPLGKNFVFGLMESVLSRPFPFPLTLVFPIYPATRLAVRAGWREERTDQVIMTLDLSWHQDDTLLYGAVIVDDIRVAKPAERKLGWLFGWQWESRDLTFGAEFAHFDRNTYTHINPALPHLYQGIGLGYPTGRDSRVTSVWGRWKVARNFQLVGWFARSELERHRQREKEWHWGLGVQGAFLPQLIASLYLTRGFPPRWGAGGGWPDAMERERFVLFEVRYQGLWGFGVTPKRPVKTELTKKVAWLMTLRGRWGMISAGRRDGIRPKMRFPIIDPLTEKRLGYFIVLRVQETKASGRIEALPGTIVRVGSKVVLTPEGRE